MAPENHVIDANNFIFYTDYYSVAATAGIERARSVFKGINPALRVNTSTFDVYDSADLSIGNLVASIRTAYDITFIEATSLAPMSGAFFALAEHIKKWTGLTVDQFLISEGIEVDSTYARISGLLGNTITSGNIRGD